MSELNQLQKDELTVSYKIGDEEIRLTPSIVQNYIVGSNATITLQEFKFFTELCKARKLNPFLREAYCIKYGNEPATIVVGKDVLVKRAVLHPQYDGKETGVIVINAAGDIIERPGCFVAPTEELVGGWARIYRKDRSKPEYMSVSLEEVRGKKRDGTSNLSWSTKPATMVEKVAKVRALREAFVDELSGMYEAEEMNTPLSDFPEPPDISPENSQVEEYAEGEIVKQVDLREV